jgi:hypothetical protein
MNIMCAKLPVIMFLYFSVQIINTGEYYVCQIASYHVSLFLSPNNELFLTCYDLMSWFPYAFMI